MNILNHMKIIFKAYCLLIPLFIFQSCAQQQINENNFFARHTEKMVNKLIQSKALDIDQDSPNQTISQSYENITIVYQANPQKGCVTVVQAFFKNLENKSKILAWVKRNKVNIVNPQKFDGQNPFKIKGREGLIFDCKRIKDGNLEVVGLYPDCPY